MPAYSTPLTEIEVYIEPGREPQIGSCETAMPTAVPTSSAPTVTPVPTPDYSSCYLFRMWDSYGDGKLCHHA